MTSAERYVIETVFEDYSRVRVFEIIDRLTGRCLRRSQTRSVLESQVQRLNSTEPKLRYQATYKLVMENMRRRQRWYVKDTETGEAIGEDNWWSRADAVYEASQMNKKLLGYST